MVTLKIGVIKLGIIYVTLSSINMIHMLMINFETNVDDINPYLPVI